MKASVTTIDINNATISMSQAASANQRRSNLEFLTKNPRLKFQFDTWVLEKVMKYTANLCKTLFPEDGDYTRSKYGYDKYSCKYKIFTYNC